MNFTREPIIETIITPKEGSKLLIRNSKREARDDYLVDAIEVISFGQSIFYRSLERPKSFVVPVSDYEVVEVKETRLALKSASIERSIKIGGGRGSPRGAATQEKKKAPEEEEKELRSEKKKERRRPRRRRASEEKEAEAPAEENGEVKKRVSRLLPPPPTLIAQTIGKYREAIHPSAPPLPEILEAEEEKKTDSKKKTTQKKEEAEEKPEPPKEEAAPPEKEEKPSEEPKSNEDKSSFWGLFS